MDAARYQQNWLAIGQELAEFLTDQEREQATEFLDQHGAAAVWSGATAAAWRSTAALLALTPGQFQKKWNRLPPEDRAMTAVRLQYLVHLSANAAAIAEMILWLPKGMRPALADAATRLLECGLAPSAEDLTDSLYE